MDTNGATPYGWTLFVMTPPNEHTAREGETIEGSVPCGIGPIPVQQVRLGRKVQQRSSRKPGVFRASNDE